MLQRAVALQAEEKTAAAFAVVKRILQEFGEQVVCSSPALADIIRRQQEIGEFVDSLDSEGWTVHVDEGEAVKVLYKPREGSALHTLRMEGIVDAPLINIFSVLNETDLFTLWIPYFTVPFKCAPK